MRGTNNNDPKSETKNDKLTEMIDDYVELVLATKENTQGVGWFITDNESAIEEECSIPFYSTVKEGANFPDADWKDQPVVRQAKISWRDDTSISWMERHMEMTQGFLLVGNAPGLMVLGEPTHDRDDLNEDEKRWPDWTRTKGYIIPPGCGIIIKKGTWHDFPVSVGPDVTAFIINTKEVVDALTSMKSPGPMNFGDCYKVRIADSARYNSDGRRKIRFPDPRPFVKSHRLVARRQSGWATWRKSLLRSTGRTFPMEDGFTEDITAEDEGKNEVPRETVTTFKYGRGMMRVEVEQWGGHHANYVWVVPIINVESFAPDAFGPSVQPHLNKTQPELANRGWRDYGNKRGLQRLGRLFGDRGIPCTAVVSSDLVENDEVMGILHRLEKEHKWEIGAHGANNSNAGHVDLSQEEEAESISKCLERLGDAFKGIGRPKTWLTPGFSVTNSTPKLLFNAGVQTLLDFVDDDVPFELLKSDSIESMSKSPLVCLPYSMETNDFSLVLTRNLSPREYAAALESHILQLARESRESGCPSVVCLGMHTFVAGTPASVHELDKVLGRLESQGNIKWATAREVTECIIKGDDGETEEEDPSQEQPSSDVAVPSSPNQASNKICVQVKPSATLRINRDRVALILIDFQNDFLCHGGFGEKLGNDPSKLQRAVLPTQNVLRAFRDAGLPVLHTREGHRPNLSDVTSLKAGNGTIIGSTKQGKFGRCMVRGQVGNDIVEELTPLSDGSETVIDKPGKGAFYQTDLELVLRNGNVDTLVVCGVTTEICVHTTVREANDRGIQCIVLEDCTASYFDEFHRVGIEMICAQGGILGKVSDSKSVIRGLEEASDFDSI
mmetsp:Transcript_18208/g.32558  ORF Transcript_18208/g.32558 Transcript_18208/m.32558 type:complete len:840 (+) Transcript_18208:135-2654(+)|eukprot:CAMPEP_0196152192 /NCGR_PEP_ID=MMETSP0910-20130528/35054_1 /TAXON_ID=49265 /ORGANISM="Thalassiosira rotula, Strain GSO102" /LENGTH=839 /DNA_ID=CAMNT_0041415731 /DNA_START=96 /DNA_END=2615 /DNA_ORIENTATION=-